ncbi:MAG: sulfatase-like hydrolase/transferase [Verrucomicrobiota bacterium]
MKNSLNGNKGDGLLAAFASTRSNPRLTRPQKLLFSLLTGWLIVAASPIAAAGVVELDGAIATNAVTSLSSSNTASLTHTTGVGDNRLTLVGISWNANTTARTISSVTFTPDGGTATNLTLVRAQISAATTYRYAAVYALTNPPSGQTGIITATFSGAVANGTVIGAANFKGVDQATPLGNSNGAGATSGATISTSLTGLNGNELIFDTVFVGGTPPPSPTANTGQTSVWNTTISNARGVASINQVASSSYTSSWTSGDSTRPWAIVAVAINPVTTPDTIAPTVTINQAAGQADPTGDSPINFTVVFSEPVTGFTTGDVTLTGTAGATTAIVTGSGNNYNVAISGFTQAGTVIASIAAGVAHDAAGNPNAASTSTDDTVTFIPDRIVISSSANPSGYLVPIYFTASIQTNGITDPAATGAVTFLANGTPFSTNAPVGGSATSDGIGSLPRGTNLISAIYSGDGNLPADTNDFVQIVTNHPPVASNVIYKRDAEGSPLSIAISELLANVTDVDGDTASLVSVSASTNGIVLVNNSGTLFYNNVNPFNDRFTYTVADGFGGTNSAFVHIVVTNTVTTLALTSSAPTNGYLANVTFTAVIKTNAVLASSAAGEVVFLANGVPFSTNTVAAGGATSASINTLPRGAANLITAIYSGDGIFTATTNSLLQVVTNHIPVAGGVTFQRVTNQSTVVIPISDLLTNVTDLDGDTVTLLNVSASARGIPVSVNAGSLVYENPNNVSDLFSYTVTDGFATNTGVVTLVRQNVSGSGGKHNILLLIADDLGADSLSLFNSTNNPGVTLPPTPNLEKLGRQGVVFPNFYARPSCSQFRAALITGKHSFRTGVGYAITGASTPSLRTNEYTLPRAFATNAPQYGVASFGKYHLSPTTDLNSPWTTGGWSNYAGFFSPGVSSYTSWTKISNGVSANTTAYSTTDQVNDSISFIQSQGTNRWFVWLAFNAPHTPRHKPPVDLAPTYASLSGTSADISAQPRKYWEAMVEALDTEIGRLLSVVDTNDTDIIFVGDNGTERDVQQWPYKNSVAAETTTGNGHGKFTVFEGGVRTPLFICGPSVANGGRTNNTIVDTVDLYQTIQELGGINVAETLPPGVIIDSKSILPALQGDVVVPQPLLLGEQFNQGAGNGVTLRNEKFKLIHLYNNTERFYDLANDPYEYTNLLASALSPEAEANFNRLRIEIAPYLNFSNNENTRNLLPQPAISTAAYSNATFAVNVQYTQLSSNVFAVNPNQPGLTRYAPGGAALNYRLILWRSPEPNNPLSWTPVATNLITSSTDNFLLSTNGLLIDANATADHNFYRVTPYFAAP